MKGERLPTGKEADACRPSLQLLPAIQSIQSLQANPGASAADSGRRRAGMNADDGRLPRKRGARNEFAIFRRPASALPKPRYSVVFLPVIAPTDTNGIAIARIAPPPRAFSGEIGADSRFPPVHPRSFRHSIDTPSTIIPPPIDTPSTIIPPPAMVNEPLIVEMVPVRLPKSQLKPPFSRRVSPGKSITTSSSTGVRPRRTVAPSIPFSGKSEKL